MRYKQLNLLDYINKKEKEMSKVSDFVNGRRAVAGTAVAVEKLESSLKEYSENVPEVKHETPFGEEYNRPEPVTTVGKPKRLVDRIAELDALAERVRLVRDLGYAKALEQGVIPNDDFIEDDGLDPEEEFNKSLEGGLKFKEPKTPDPVKPDAEPDPVEDGSADGGQPSGAQAADE